MVLFDKTLISYKCSTFLVNNQPDAFFHVFIYSLHLSTCFEHHVLIIGISNCTNTSSAMIGLCKWLLDLPVLTSIPSSHLHRLTIPDDVLIQFDLPMTSTWCSKHVQRWNEKINTWKNASGWLLTRICDEIHGQQNIKKCSTFIYCYPYSIVVFFS